MKSKFVCRRCGVAVGQWAKGSTTIWKHQANMHNPSCGKPAIPVEREGYERDMASFVEDAMIAVQRMREPEKKVRCANCDGFGYHDFPGEPECEVCEGNGVAEPSRFK